MTVYRLYEIDEAGRVRGASIIMDARDDAEVVERAQAYREFHAVEIWDGSRRVAWLHRKSD